jgi:hypothetical protein
VIDYEIIVLDPEKNTSMVQIIMCCWNVGLQWYARNRSTVREQNSGLTQLLALEQSVAAPVLCSPKMLIGR